MSYLGGAWKQMGRDKARWLVVIFPLLIAALWGKSVFVPTMVVAYGMAWIGFAEKWRERAKKAGKP